MVKKTKFPLKRNEVNMKISVLGSGAFGIAISISLHYNRHDVHLWSFMPEITENLVKTRSNEDVLKNVKIPEGVTFTDDISCVSDSEIVIIATPSFAVLETLNKIRDKISNDTIIVLLAKGINSENGEYYVFSELAAKVLHDNQPIVALTGPTHAEEIAIKKPCAILAASNKEEAAKKVQKSFMNEFFRVYTTEDIKGAQLGGALKNIIAIASGISGGMGFGDNATAALITRGFVEIQRLGVKMGANPETFMGLSGIGDLIVTCMSRHSRNRRTGEFIGSGLAPKEAIEKVGTVVEGYYATKSAFELSKKYGIEMPITTAVYEVLYLEKKPEEIFKELMGRTGKAENIF